MKTKALIYFLILFLFSVTVYQQYRINNIKANFKQLLDIVSNESYYTYTSLDTNIDVNYLDEVTGFESEDILKRIEMLRDHVNYYPSPKWINDVSLCAKNEIINLRKKQEKK